jgi:hypothetical protein
MRHLVRLAGLATVVMVGAGTAIAAHASGGDAPRRPWTADLDRPQPAPPAVSSFYPVVYQARTILRSARYDLQHSTVTLPLRRGAMRDGRSVWYVLTDASDPAAAAQQGLNWSPKLRNAPAAAVRTAWRTRDGSLVFDAGTVDFTPERVVVPGAAPQFFPPAQARAGSVGDHDYSPLVRVRNAAGLVLNATVVAFDVAPADIEYPHGGIDYRKVIDRAVAISPANGTVTLRMSTGTSGGRAVLFVSLDSNSETVSALEATTYAPALRNLPVGRNDEPDSTVANNYIVANGPVGARNPHHQGLDYALSDPQGQVLDILDGAPGVLNGTAYSPMWDLYVAEWTAQAIADGHRAALRSELDVLDMAARGLLTAPGGAALSTSGLVSNCPLIVHF